MKAASILENSTHKLSIIINFVRCLELNASATNANSIVLTKHLNSFYEKATYAFWKD